MSARGGAIACAHDVSDGGLACAVAEAAVSGGLGARLDLDPLVELRGCSGETALFGEGPGGFVMSGDRQALAAIEEAGVDVLVIGEVGGEALEIDAAEHSLALPLAEAERAWRSLGAQLAS